MGVGNFEKIDLTQNCVQSGGRTLRQGTAMRRTTDTSSIVRPAKHIQQRRIVERDPSCADTATTKSEETVGTQILC